MAPVFLLTGIAELLGAMATRLGRTSLIVLGPSSVPGPGLNADARQRPAWRWTIWNSAGVMQLVHQLLHVGRVVGLSCDRSVVRGRVFCHQPERARRRAPRRGMLAVICGLDCSCGGRSRHAHDQHRPYEVRIAGTSCVTGEPTWQCRLCNPVGAVHNFHLSARIAYVGEPHGIDCRPRNRRWRQPLDQQLPATARWVATLPSESSRLRSFKGFHALATTSLACGMTTRNCSCVWISC